MRADIEPAGNDRMRRFETLFEVYYESVRGFVARRTGASVVEDVVADTFLVAWRRFDDVDGDVLPWLLGVARRVIANELRGERRRDNLIGRLKGLVVESEPEWVAPEEMNSLLAAALRSLSGPEREALFLIAWDGLSPMQAAEVAGCSPAAFRVRLHRARRRLSTRLTIGTGLGASELGPATLLTRELT